MSSAPEYAYAPPPDPAPHAPGDGDGERPHWPLWTPFAAVAVGLAAGLIVAGMIAAIAESVDPSLKTDSPWFTSLSSFAVDVCVVGASIGMAGITARVRPWQFGLRRAPLGFAAGMAAIAFGVFLIFELVYGAVFNPHNPQTIVQDLGADRNTALLVTGAVVVIVVAPFCEEFFFRGFLFRVLRMRMGFWLAAVLDGVLFGAAHGSLVILPVLAVLGVALCWVYERTGSIFPTIALHALNNTIAYGGSTAHGWGAALGVGGAMIAACGVALVALPQRQGVTNRPSNV